MNIEQFDDNRSRKIRIWTPAGYEDNLAHNYPVIYMHNGQNLFDAYTSFSGEWQVDETINQMINENFAGAIVVGINNGGDKRLDELSPTWPLSSSVSQYNIKPEGEKYASFIVETLKPYIDQNFRTLSDRENTLIGGSSMGGVMSLYMTFAYSSTFGKSLIFSPSMWVYQNNSIETFIQTSNVSQLTNRPKVYVYAGGGELTIAPFVPVIYDTLIENGYDDTLVKTHIQSGQGHNEAAWALHLPLALDWLLASI